MHSVSHISNGYFNRRPIRKERFKKMPADLPVQTAHGIHRATPPDRQISHVETFCRVVRILTAQGPDAPGGAYDYVVDGKMIGGFALVAYPARYGVSGVMTFTVNHQGVVYEKDLGPGTENSARAMQTYNPDGAWKKVEESPPPAR